MMGRVSAKFSCLVGFVVAASFIISGCGGVECGEGTTEQDGECVQAGELECPEGTVEDNGECIPEDLLQCGEGTVEQDGQCVADQEPVEEIDCDDGEVYKEGECVAEVTCGANTELSEDNRCVADEPVHCGTDTELDPNENECVVTDQVCGDNTAFSGDLQKCVPTDEVCQEGTYFDDESGLCYPEAQCQAGDVVLDGYCVSEAEEMAANADYVGEGEDTVLVEVPEPGERAVFTGTIDPPSDLNEDGTPDQYADFYQFSANAGDWIEVSVRSMGLFDPAFQVIHGDFDPDSYNRVSAIGTGSMKTRQLVVPEDGDYFIIVLPELALLQDAPLGGEDWDYVGSIEELDRPTAQTHDFEAENFEGTLGPLEDSYVHIDGYEAGDSISIGWESMPEDSDPVMQVWDSETGFVGQYDDMSVPMTIPETGELFVIFDWIFTFGAGPFDYEISLTDTFSLDDGETTETTFSADAGDGVRVRVDHSGDSEVHVQIQDDAQVEVAAESVAAGGEMTHFDLVGGEYTVTFENTSGEEITDVQFSVDVAPLVEIDDFDATVRDLVQVSQSNPGEHQIYAVVAHASSGDVELESVIASGGSGVFYAAATGEYAVSHYDFDEIDDIELEFTISGVVEIGTFSVATDDGDQVVEVGHDHEQDTVPIAIFRDSTDEMLVDGVVGHEDNGLAVVGPLSGTYSVNYIDLEGVEVDAEEVEISTNFVDPMEVTDFTETFSGTSNEFFTGPHDYYLISIGETTAYEVILEHMGGSGWAAAFIYSPNHEEHIMSDTLTGEGQEASVDFEFIANATYIIRVGFIEMHGSFIFDEDFDYDLSFEEL